MMISSNPSQSPDVETSQKFRFSDHPWISLIVFVFLNLFLMVLASIAGVPNWWFYHILLLFVIVPFLLKLPNNHQTYTLYLDDIRLSHIRPIAPLLLLGLSCWIIMALSQAAGSVVYALSQGDVVDASFLASIVDVSADLQGNPNSVVNSMPSMFEEVAWRGVILVLFMTHYSERRSIVVTSIGFGLMHLLNLSGSGRDLTWVLFQVGWTAILGIFYAYITLRTDSLLPAMLVHWLSNSFVYSFTRYVQDNASSTTDALFGIIFNFGIIPTTLMILWVRFYLRKWPIKD